MKLAHLARALVLLAGLVESACGILPAGGPSMSVMKASTDVDLVTMTPDAANAQSAELDRTQAMAVTQALATLSTAEAAPPFTFGPGTKMTVTLWSFSPRPGSVGPASLVLGNFTVAPDGAVLLPYVNRVNLTGLTLQQAQSELEKRFTTTGLFQKPSISIDVSATPKGQIIVTGAVGQPHTVSWPAGGITLAEALTQSLGDGAAVLGQEDDAAGHFVATRVTVIRDHGPSAELPISVALDKDIPLRPGDRVVVKKQPAVEVTILGAGGQSNGVYAFGHIPTLSEVLGRGSGLNGNSADGRAVFVLRERQGEKPVLYNFAWSTTQGVIAAHHFPMQSGDLVYVAEAPIMSVQRVINILFQVALPAQVFK